MRTPANHCTSLWDNGKDFASGRREKREHYRARPKVNVQFKLDLDAEARFIAKVALSAGYFFYGDQFRHHALTDSRRR